MIIGPEQIAFPGKAFETIAVLTVFFILLPAAIGASKIKKDEEVIFFPTNAHLDAEAKTWIIPVHGWIFEPENESLWRKAVLKSLAKKLELEDGAEENALFRKRARMFLVDNERWKKPDIRIGKHVFTMKRSKANGHFKGSAVLNRDEADKLASGLRLGFSAVTKKEDPREFKGFAQILPPKGVSVISDIDDTIKATNVPNKKELLANTFLREFKPVPGMAKAYKKWREAGAAFHYVSSSPWQLFPFLSSFMKENGFPSGSFHLKLFRMKDRSFFNLFASSEETKPPVIASILNTYPERTFVMVGDSGENDPEIYGAFASKYPRHVTHIFIRKVPGADNSADRFANAFRGVDSKRWIVFDDPDVLQKPIMKTGKQDSTPGF